MMHLRICPVLGCQCLLKIEVKSFLLHVVKSLINLIQSKDLCVDVLYRLSICLKHVESQKEFPQRDK